ncbi:MAG: DUF3179 domain-containing protein [Actinobacteria bacterium]|nr:DUF3179 domain-containing protein [Actinomycetota bacterium]
MRAARSIAVLLGVIALGIGAVALLRAGDDPAVGGAAGPAATDPVDSRRNHVPFTPSGDALVDPDLIISGGPPPDGIPPIDDPKFLSPDEVGFLTANEPVLSVVVDDEAKAYPLRIMMWHEIVNDEIGGSPVTVTYCPLCNTGIAFRRPVVDGDLLDFGTSGRLYNSNLVMYDRQTETYWSQATGQAILGDLVGMELEFVPAQVVSWGDWRATYPGGRVLSQDTGWDRAYGQNPYQGYDSPDNDRPFLFVGTPDPRLVATTRVLGVSVGSSAIAIPYEELVATARDGASVAEAEVGGSPVVVLWKEGTASALDQAEIAASRDVGSATAYDPRSGGVLLRFAPEGGGFVDMQTGSRWDIFGRAVSGPLEGTQLEALPAVDHFWFSWAAFFPETEIYGA